MVTKKSKSKISLYKITTITLSVLIIILFVIIIYLAKNKISYEDSQKIQAFESITKSYIAETLFVENEQTAKVTDFGMTDDKDLYADFVVTKYDNSVPIATRTARLHFQCANDSNSNDNISAHDCSEAYRYDDWEKTSEEYREKYRHYIDEMNHLVKEYNSAETDTERNSIKQQESDLYEQYKDFFVID